MSAWYVGPRTPGLELWWAVEHRGHPAFYLRALMPGDFAPGQAGPLTRHASDLEGVPMAHVLCETCGARPDPADLEPIERATGDRGHLARLRQGLDRWPPPTDPASCYLCSDPGRTVDETGHCAACSPLERY